MSLNDSKVAPGIPSFIVSTQRRAPEVQTIIAAKNAPTISFYFCGGTGINTYNRVSMLLPESAHIQIFDTADKSNRIDTNIDVTILTPAAVGSGGDRNENSRTIAAALSEVDHVNEDIAFVVFGKSGGSGSVIGPLWAKELHRRDQSISIIGIAIADHESSQQHSDNMKGATKSLISICEKNGISIPLIIYDNKYGRNIVDKEVTNLFKMFLQIFTTQINEIDPSDFLNFIAHKSTTPGIKCLNVRCTNSNEIVSSAIQEDSDVYESILTIIGSTDAESEFKQVSATRSFSGIFESPDFPSIRLAISEFSSKFEELAKETEDHLNSLKQAKAAQNKASVWKVSGDEDDLIS